MSVALSITGCSSTPAPDATIGQLRTIDQGTAMTVPALWAASQSDGSLVGGIEPAEVQVTQDGDGQFSIDLSTIEAGGAGPQWTAATAQAAAVGTLLSGTDPSALDLGFTVTGAIDGPSAGGLLTVGVLADIQGDSLLPGVTMTGTISPDGSIGAVGYVPTKLAAAAAAGYTTAVIPAGLGQFTDNAGASMTLVEYGKSLGIDVKEVRTVAQAYQLLTGKAYAQLPSSVVQASAPSNAAIISTTKAMRASLQKALVSVPPGTQGQAINLARAALVSMDAAIAAGKWDQAYGVGAFAYLRLARAEGAAKVTDDVSKLGIVKAEVQLRKAITAALSEAKAARDAAIQSAKPTVEQTLSLPGAIGWATYAVASYQGLLLELDKPNSAKALSIAGRILEENRAGVNVMMPDALAVLNAQPARTSAPEGKVKEFLNGYTKLLNIAAAANFNYFRVLSGTVAKPDGKVSEDGVVGTSSVLQKPATSKNEPGTLEDSLLQVANALTYFVVSSGVLASHQAYGLETADNDLMQSSTPEAVDAAVATGATTIESYSAKLRAKNLTVGYPLWSSRWGKAAADSYQKTNLATEAGWIGLNEIWYDAVSMFMMNAFTQKG